MVAGQSVKLRVPVSFGGQLLQDAKDSLARKDFAQAQESQYARSSFEQSRSDSDFHCS